MALGKSVAEIMALSIAEVVDWERFHAEHPFPADMLDVHMAMQSCIIANSNRDPKQGRAYQVSEFMLIGAIKKKPPHEDEADRITKALEGF